MDIGKSVTVTLPEQVLKIDSQLLGDLLKQCTIKVYDAGDIVDKIILKLSGWEVKTS